MRRAIVITVSDGVASGEREDLSGPETRRLLIEGGFQVDAPRVVPDERATIAKALRDAADEAPLVVTTGGTGLATRDVTPEATRDVLDREAPGIAEWMRAHGQTQTPLAAMSRGVVGVRGNTLIVNLPGRPAAVQDGLAALGPILPHAMALLEGQTQHAPQWTARRAGRIEPAIPKRRNRDASVKTPGTRAFRKRRSRARG